MKAKKLRRLMTSLVRSSGTMGVLVAGGCSGSVMHPDSSSAGSASGGTPTSMAGASSDANENGGSSSSGSTSAFGGTPSPGGTPASGGAAGTSAGGALGCAGAECGPSAGTSWCGDTGGYGGCMAATSAGCGGGGLTGVSGAGCVAPCTVPKEWMNPPIWRGTIPLSCLPSNPVTSSDCQSLCGYPVGGSCSIVETTAETATVSCIPFHGGGRRPPGLIGPETCLDSADYFANASMLEAASVLAFRVLERELAGLHAPRRLLRGVRRAARDERRHARAMRSLARRFGGSVRGVSTTPTPRRSLLEIAVDNATEGCVRETFGALAATYQAELATDLQVRATMRRVARDETSHAALSWQIARWLEPRLCPAERQQVADAMQAATRKLRSELAGQTASPVALGLPSAQASLELLQALQAHLPETGLFR